MRLKRLLGFAVIVALAGGCGAREQMGAEALFHLSESLRSQAAEGALLAQHAASGRTTRIYTREHASDLAMAASRAEVTLNAATTEPGLEATLRQLAVLAGRVSADLDRLGSASMDEDRALARELQAAALVGQRIGERIT